MGHPIGRAVRSVHFCNMPLQVVARALRNVTSN
jgi:hypothetical protein